MRGPPRKNEHSDQARSDERPHNPLLKLGDSVTASAHEPPPRCTPARDRDAMDWSEEDGPAPCASTILIQALPPLAAPTIKEKHDCGDRHDGQCRPRARVS